MMPEDERRAGLRKAAGLFDLLGGREAEAFLAPMDREDNVMNVGLESTDIRDEPIDVKLGDPIPRSIGEMRRPGAAVDGTEEREAQSADIEDQRERQPPRDYRRRRSSATPVWRNSVRTLWKPAWRQSNAWLLASETTLKPAAATARTDLRGGYNARFGRHGLAVAGQRALKIADDDVGAGEGAGEMPLKRDAG